MEIVIFAALLGIIPAVIANRKGRDFFSWWLFGALLFIVALPLAILREPATEGSRAPFRKCDYCAERIMGEAVVCKHCGRDLPPRPVV